MTDLPLNVAPSRKVHKNFHLLPAPGHLAFVFALLLAAGCSRQAPPPPENPWPELMQLDAVAARAEQRILAGVGRGELGELSEELTFAIAKLLKSSPPATTTDPERVRLLLSELERGLQLLNRGQSMNPDLLIRFHGLSAALMQAAGMADLHQH